MTRTDPAVRRRLPPTLLIGIALMLSCAGCANRASVRNGPRHWQLRGAVMSVGDTTVDIRHKTGRVIELEVDDRTTYEHRHHDADRRELRQGTRVAVDVESTPQSDRAVHIEVF